MTAVLDDRPVVMVTSSPAPYHPRHYHLMATGLRRAGVPVVVVAQPDRALHANGPIPVRRLPERGSRLTRMLSGPLTMARVARMRPGLIQVNSLDLLPWAAIARRLVRIPLMYDSSEDYEAYMLIKEWLPRAIRVPMSRLVGRLEPWLSGTLDATLVADRGNAERFAEHGTEALVVSNFPWLDFGRGVSGAPRYDVTYHGTLPGYHVDHILATAVELRARGLELRWCLAARDYGPGERRALEGRVTAAGLADAFTLHYNLRFEDMPALLSATRIGFIPLPDERKFHRNVPRKLFEFMLFGRPAVVSDLPPVRRLVGDAGCCLLVTPGDDRGYADALENLLRDPGLAEEMGRRGRALVERELNAESALVPYVALCRHLLARGAR